MCTKMIGALLLCMGVLSTKAQLIKRVSDKAVRTAETAVERKTQQKTEQTIPKAIENNSEGNNAQNTNAQRNGNHPTNLNARPEANNLTTRQNNLSFIIAYDAPQAVTKVSNGQDIRWLDIRVGNKFKMPEDARLQQVIAVNPFLSPERPFFSELLGLQSLPDGSIIVAGSAGLNADGDPSGLGWWKVSKDGSITSYISRPIGSKHIGVFPSSEFSVAPDGSILTIYTEEIKTNRVGTKIVRLHPNGQVTIVAEGLDNPKIPIQDPLGNIWVANRNGEELLRIDKNGTKSIIVAKENGWSNTTMAPQDRITLGFITWDKVHGELVTGGSFITSKPHDLHSSVWRIRPDGVSRRVYYNVKNGQSAVGQAADAIWSLSVNPQGDIVLATRIMKNRARRQIIRLNEKTGKIDILTGQSFTKNSSADFTDYRPGHEEAPYDGKAAHANFREAINICYTTDGTLFILDQHQVRRLDKDGIVRTWAY
jgi:hypothetical protein